MAMRIGKCLLFALALSWLVSCKDGSVRTMTDRETTIDLDSITKRGVLRAATDYNSLNYFVLKGEAVGFQYELLKEYANHCGLKLEIVAKNDVAECVKLLNNGSVDIVAASMIADSTLIRDIKFCKPYGQSRIVLVSKDTVKEPGRLADTISVMANSMYVRLLEDVTDTADRKIVIKEIPHYGAEQIVGLVADGDLRQTACLEVVARASKWYYDGINIENPISDKKDMAWGVRRNSPLLEKDISSWTAKFLKEPKFRRLYSKYVGAIREDHNRVSGTGADTYRSDYEDIIKAVATNKLYDWMLVSAVVYQESRFNPKAVSWAGACGLMQLMPETAERFGVDDPRDPEQSIEAGYRFIEWLDVRMQPYVSNAEERRKFVLAAYNIGLGHIMDAIRLAEKTGRDPKVWYDNVESALLLKSNPIFASDPVVRHGFCRGTETVNYVKSVLTRYTNYKSALKKRK